MSHVIQIPVVLMYCGCRPPLFVMKLSYVSEIFEFKHDANRIRQNICLPILRFELGSLAQTIEASANLSSVFYTTYCANSYTDPTLFTTELDIKNYNSKNNFE